MKIRMI